VKINAKEVNGYLCAIGLFGFDAHTSTNRVTMPMKKQGGKLVPVSWGEALKTAAEALKKAGASAGFIASGSLTNEEAYALQDLARRVVGSANIDTPAAAYAGGLVAALRSVYGEAGIGIAAQADLGSADCVVVIGADPSQKKQSLQEVDVMIRRRVQAGAKLIVVSTEKTDLAGHPNAMLLQLKAGTDAQLLAGLMSAALAEGAAPSAKGVDGLKKSLISADQAASASGVAVEQIAAAAKAYAAAKHPVVVIGTGVSLQKDACLQALNLAQVKGAGVLPLFLEANAIGVMQMGCLSDAGPGSQKAKKAGKCCVDMKSGMKTLYVAGNLPESGLKADFLIVQASHRSALVEKADLVLPMTALYEREGTIVNVYGVHKSVAPARESEDTAKDGAAIAAELSLVLSKTKGFKHKDVAAAVKKVKAGKISTGGFKPVPAVPAKHAAVSTRALLAVLNDGMLSASAVSKVMTVRETVSQK